MRTMRYNESFISSMMERAIELSKKGRGSVSPNPLVGCLIVKDDKITSVKILRVGPEAKSFDPTQFDHKNLEIKNPIAEWQADFSLPGKEVVTDSGLRMIIHKKGNGQLPQAGQGVNVHYYGMFENGKMFEHVFYQT